MKLTIITRRTKKELLNDVVLDSVVNVLMVSDEQSNTGGGLTAKGKIKWKRRIKV